jgi:hypothetical protein
VYYGNPSKAIQFADFPCSKYIFEFVFFVTCLYCIIIKLGIKVIIILLLCDLMVWKLDRTKGLKRKGLKNSFLFIESDKNEGKKRRGGRKAAWKRMLP